MTSDVITIRDAGGSSASILPGLGFNCFSFKPIVDGKAVETIWAEPGFNATSPPDLSGIPILFPFGGRIGSGGFTFQGRDYTTPSATNQAGDAWHGFVLRRPWRVTEKTSDRVTGEFQASVDGPELLNEWPSDFKIAVTYTVAGSGLRASFVFSNPDDKPMPFYFATHPYFQLSLGGGKPEEARVTIPASTYWELQNSEPSGRLLPVDDRNDLRSGPALAGRNMNDVYSGLAYADGAFRCAVHDPSAGRTLTQTTPDDFNCCVVYTHREREAIAIEPYIGVPDSFRLEASGLATGMKALDPGAEYRTEIVIRLEASGTGTR